MRLFTAARLYKLEFRGDELEEIIEALKSDGNYWLKEIVTRKVMEGLRKERKTATFPLNQRAKGAMKMTFLVTREMLSGSFSFPFEMMARYNERDVQNILDLPQVPSSEFMAGWKAASESALKAVDEVINWKTSSAGLIVRPAHTARDDRTLSLDRGITLNTSLSIKGAEALPVSVMDEPEKGV